MVHRRRCHDATLALLTGVVVGAMYRLWPWQDGSLMYSPASYARRFGQDDLPSASARFVARQLPSC
ncbi:hypothetical protein [Alishewanella longhuensis]